MKKKEKTLDIIKENQDNPDIETICGVGKLKPRKDDENDGGGGTVNTEHRTVVSNIMTHSNPNISCQKNKQNQRLYATRQ